ncbi:DUF2330 domain-containing protein [Streptomyces griseoruber]|uniref:DUF2330 domain-containing protein n=1 Tax=Streptomyces griseoruber TaxID=1943 RepID=UPI0037A5E2BD
MRPRGERRGAGMRLHARIVAVLLALLALQLGSLVAPAYACACGALVPGDGRRLTVGREESVVRWDGKQEQIVMSLRVGGDAARAAWIMPVPHRATVELGDAELFDQLATATAPVQRTRTHFWPQDGDWPLTTGDGRGGPPRPPGGSDEVAVVGRERLGPFDVARLTATDPAALDDWLSSNDFALPPGLETALRPYVDRRWEYVAVKLTPETAGSVLDGELQPLHLTFAADAPVYPMRLSRLAATPQSLGLYVLAAHRMEPVSRIGGERPRVTFAGRVGASAGGPLGELAQGTPFLTAVAQEFPRPSAISGDHELRRAPADTAFRQVIYEDRLLRVVGIPVWLLTVVGGLTVAAAAPAALALRRRRAHRAAQPGPRHASAHHSVPPGGVPGKTAGETAGGTAGGSPGGAPAGTRPRTPGRTTPGVPGETAGGAPGGAPAGTRPRTTPLTPPMPGTRPTATGAPPVPPGPPVPPVPPMPTAHPTATGVPPRPTTRPTGAAVPPRPPMPPQPQQTPQPQPTARHAQSTQRPQRSQRSQRSQQPQQARQTHQTPPPPPHPPTAYETPAPSPASASASASKPTSAPTPPAAPPRPSHPPVTPPRTPTPPKPFTLPVTPRPNG